MKKIFTLLLAFTVFSSTLVFAAESNIGIEKMNKEEMLKAYEFQLKESGYTDKSLSHYDEIHLREVIKNKGKLESAVDSYDLFVQTEIKINKSAKKVEYKKINLTKSEYDYLTKFKSKEETLDYLNKKGLKSFKNYDGATVLKEEYKKYSSSSDDSVTDNIDFGILYTSLTVADMSNTTTVKKDFTMYFNWSNMPFWTLTDGLGIACNLDDFDEVYGKGFGAQGYYGNTEYDLQTTCSYEGNCGVEGTVDITNIDERASGTLYCIIGDQKQYIPKGKKFTVFAQYGHDTGLAGIGVNIGVGSVTFSGSGISESTQLVAPNLTTW